ncbi:MAG: hypothetical protein WDM91_17500 [Rhizomicrobium sp.]
MVEDRFPNDPFFRRNPDITWNACIGVQGDEENYIEGYIEAATELASSVIGKNMPERRDTLVLPILYNARHAIELVLKFCLSRLARAKLLKREFVRNHNIRSYWMMLDEAELGDRALSRHIAALKPFIDSLSAIDQDGQELRYHRNKSDDTSMANYSLANLVVIRESLLVLAKAISDLRYRLVDYFNERATGTFTNECSRSDLLAITKLLPPIAAWNEPKFDEAKDAIKTSFGLSGKAFCRAIDAIKGSREMRTMLGTETPLLYISDEKIEAVISKWNGLRRHNVGSGFLGDARKIEWHAGAEDRRKIINDLCAMLTPEELADLHAVFYLGRDRSFFPENYEAEADRVLHQIKARSDFVSDAVYLFDKGNLQSALAIGLLKLGRLTLARKLT